MAVSNACSTVAAAEWKLIVMPSGLTPSTASPRALSAARPVRSSRVRDQAGGEFAPVEVVAEVRRAAAADTFDEGLQGVLAAGSQNHLAADLRLARFQSRDRSRPQAARGPPTCARLCRLLAATGPARIVASALTKPAMQRTASSSRPLRPRR